MISLIGIGSKREHMTLKAADRIKEADVIIAYKPYLTHIEDLIEGKEVYRRGMGDEMDRVELAIEKEKEGKKSCNNQLRRPGNLWNGKRILPNNRQIQ